MFGSSFVCCYCCDDQCDQDSERERFVLSIRSAVTVENLLVEDITVVLRAGSRTTKHSIVCGDSQQIYESLSISFVC